MKEKKIHDLIEQGNEENKKQSLQTVRNNLEQDNVVDGVNNGINAAAIRSKKLIVPIAAAFFAVVALILCLTLYDWGRTDEFYFSSNGSYIFQTTDMTLKDYSEQNGYGLLYFDWYEETDYNDKVCIANDTEEIICFREYMADEKLGNDIILYVAANNIKLDFLSIYDDLSETYVSGGTNVKWGGDYITSDAYATFEYGGFNYYLQVNRIAGGVEQILHYVDILLN